MALSAPNLDDRTFQDLVREARAMIPRYCPEWTDHNLSDPGITLIELFAWMVDILLYRLNKVPDRNYIKFMELVGIRLEPPKQAIVDVNFRLSTPQPGSITIPLGTEVATVRTETLDAISFTTDKDLVLYPPTLEYALISPVSLAFNDCSNELRNTEKMVAIFNEVPEESNAFYLGFNEDLSSHVLLLSFKCRSEGIGVDPSDAPLVWEFWDGQNSSWRTALMESDTTGGLNVNGQVVLHLPVESSKTTCNNYEAFWVRCRVVKARKGQRPYSASPKLTGVSASSIGGTVTAVNAQRIMYEIVGQSDGTPGQRFFVNNIPVLSREAGETTGVELQEEIWEEWSEVPDFSESGPNDNHFMCDGISGEIQFGPCIRLPSGEERQFGRIPPMGQRIRFSSYRSGGGVIGNVGKNTITVLKSSIPYVASVINLQAAEGGTEPETIESAKMRIPQLMRACTRAVTSEDFEYLTVQSSPQVARVKCITPGAGGGTRPDPGVVKLIIVPLTSRKNERIPMEELQLTRHTREEIQAYLDERRLLGTRLEITVPKYVPVAVEARIKGNPETDYNKVADEIEQALYNYINPVYGGPDGKGWPFGGGISLSQLYAMIQMTSDFDYIRDIKLFPVDPESEELQEANVQVVVSIDSMICSHTHSIIVE
ncbi:putative baseplate assembly protein [Chloroflexota bacterium]